MKKNLIIIIVWFCAVTQLQAQQLPMQYQNMFNKYSLSPAYAGFNGNTEAFIGYRQNWLGMNGAPTQSIINVNGLIQEKMGFGIAVNTRIFENRFSPKEKPFLFAQIVRKV